MKIKLEERVKSLLKQIESFPLITPYGVCPHQELQFLIKEGILPVGESFEEEDVESSSK